MFVCVCCCLLFVAICVYSCFDDCCYDIWCGCFELVFVLVFLRFLLIVFGLWWALVWCWFVVMFGNACGCLMCLVICGFGLACGGVACLVATC